MEFDGGTCTDLSLGRVEVTDVGTPQVPQLNYRVSVVSLQCRVWLRGGQLAVNVTLGDSVLELGLSLRPADVEGWTTPLGEVELTHCGMDIQLQRLDFDGQFTFAPALEMLRGKIVKFAQNHVPAVFCTAIEPLIEEGAADATRMAADRLAPFLREASADSATDTAPTDGLEPVNWGAYAPFQFLVRLLAERAAQLPALLRPLSSKELGVGFSVSGNSSQLAGAEVDLVVEKVRLQGLETVDGAALSLAGEQSRLGVRAAFGHLSVSIDAAARIGVQEVPQLGEDEPLHERFTLTLGLQNSSVGLEALVLLSRAGLDGLSVDQMQRPGCLAGCARDAAGGAPAPFRILDLVANVTPFIGLSLPGPLESDLAAVADTTIAAVLRGHLPALGAALRGAAKAAHEQLDPLLATAMDQLEPCGASRVQQGLGQPWSSMIICASVAVMIFGLGVVGAHQLGLDSWLAALLWSPPLNDPVAGPDIRACAARQTPRQAGQRSPVKPSDHGHARVAQEWFRGPAATQALLQLLPELTALPWEARGPEPTAQKASVEAESRLAFQSGVPFSLVVLYPCVALSTALVILYTDVQLGTAINLIFEANGNTVTIGPAFTFSMDSCIHHALRAGAYWVAFLVFTFSGVWPLLKLSLLIFAWLAPRQRLSRTARGRMLHILDDYGKYSLVDSWLAIFALAGYRLKWTSSDGSVSILVDPACRPTFFIFIMATVVSLVLGHIATACHRWAEEREDFGCAAAAAALAAGHPSQAEVVAGKASQQWRALCTYGSPKMAYALAVALGLTGMGVFVGAQIPSFTIHTSGLLASFILAMPDPDREFSLLSLGQGVAAANPGEFGAIFLRDVFLIFNFILPLALVGLLFVLWVVPMARSWQRTLLLACEMLDVWAAYDVFLIALMVSKFEMGILASYLVYYDNVATVCGMVRDYLDDECMSIACRFTSGFPLLCISGVAVYILPKVAVRVCHANLNERDSLAGLDSDIDTATLSTLSTMEEDGCTTE